MWTCTRSLHIQVRVHVGILNLSIMSMECETLYDPFKR